MQGLQDAVLGHMTAAQMVQNCEHCVRSSTFAGRLVVSYAGKLSPHPLRQATYM